MSAKVQDSVRYLLYLRNCPLAGQSGGEDWTKAKTTRKKEQRAMPLCMMKARWEKKGKKKSRKTKRRRDDQRGEKRGTMPCRFSIIFEWRSCHPPVLSHCSIAGGWGWKLIQPRTSFSLSLSLCLPFAPFFSPLQKHQRKGLLETARL